MNRAILEVDSTLTDRYQTTIPEAVRNILHLGKKDKIHYTVQSNGNVVISRVDKNEDDKCINTFLSFLENDIQNNPQHIAPMGLELLNKIRVLVEGVDIDLNAPLPDDEEECSSTTKGSECQP